MNNIDHVLEALEIIQESTGNGVPKETIKGVIECPKCKHKLIYVKNSYNGHIWGKCETDNCISWMQ